MMPAVRPVGQGRQDAGRGANAPLAPLYNGWLHPAVVRDGFEQQVARGSIRPTWPFLGLQDNGDLTLFMDEVMPHFG